MIYKFQYHAQYHVFITMTVHFEHGLKWFSALLTKEQTLRIVALVSIEPRKALARWTQQPRHSTISLLISSLPRDVSCCEVL